MKSKRVKRMITAAVLAAALCITLAGCGNGSKEAPQADASGKTETGEGVSEEAAS